VTYFLNGGVEVPHPGEEHYMLESRKDVRTHDEAPEMKAHDIADAAVEYISKGTDFLFINFANADMVGHTANHHAVIQAVEAVDQALGKVLSAIERVGGVAIVTADHGNAEITYDAQSGERHTSHTTNLVPCCIVGIDKKLREEGNLTDLAPTVLSLFDCPVPESMTGKSLI
jgi:2,3-bisphosphoglycerate-independent phosphoglycerate mutase